VIRELNSCLEARVGSSCSSTWQQANQVAFCNRGGSVTGPAGKPCERTGKRRLPISDETAKSSVLQCRGDLLNELVTLEITSPEAMTSLLATHKKGSSIFKNLDILPDACSTDTSVSLTWRAPTKNIQRIEGYKLSMCNQNGHTTPPPQAPHTTTLGQL